MDTAALNTLLCPICGLEFSDNQPRSLACANGHSFDIARQGYLNLLTGHGTKFVPDTADMVAARDAFLDAGHYLPLGAALAEAVQAQLASTGSGPALIVDAGTGTGWYLHQILAALAPEPGGVEPGPDSNHGPDPASGTRTVAAASSGSSGTRSVAAVGLDISKFALRRAARRNPAAVNIVWDLWRELPLGANAADVVLVIFAPRNATEFARILKPGGALVVVTPLPQHLAEIAQDAGMLGIQDDKEAALTHSMASNFSLVASQELVVPLRLAPADVGNVALMGPAGHHLDPVELGARLAKLPPLTTATAAFRISVFTAVPAQS